MDRAECPFLLKESTACVQMCMFALHHKYIKEVAIGVNSFQWNISKDKQVCTSHASSLNTKGTGLFNGQK